MISFSSAEKNENYEAQISVSNKEKNENYYLKQCESRAPSCFPSLLLHSRHTSSLKVEFSNLKKKLFQTILVHGFQFCSFKKIHGSLPVEDINLPKRIYC